MSIPRKFITTAAQIAAVAEVVVSAASHKRSYRYERKQYLLTRSERAFFDVLTQAVGQRYYVFAQVRLSGLLDEKIKGQSWRGALGKVNQKSVDFVLCDKAYVSPVLVIELDGNSHERADRKERDREVEDILADAGLPLLRWRVGTDFDADKIAAAVKEKLG